MGTHRCQASLLTSRLSCEGCVLSLDVSDIWGQIILGCGGLSSAL